MKKLWGSKGLIIESDYKDFILFVLWTKWLLLSFSHHPYQQQYPLKNKKKKIIKLAKF